MILTPPVRVACLSVIVAVSLGGCNGLTKFSWLSRDKAPEIRRVALAPELAAAPRAPIERLYATAAGELRARRYGRAIEILHLARQDAPADARVLNGLGVAYDKLGRFDLSARYYDLALRADPASTIVRANMDYSARLQGRAVELASAAPSRLTRSAEVPALRTSPQFASAEPAVMRVATGGGAAMIRSQPLLTGADLVILDGSGRAGAGERVRTQLAARGWSVAPGVQVQRARWASSEIRFPVRHRAAATALARTLPFATRLAVCADGCTGLSLTIGADARWNG